MFDTRWRGLAAGAAVLLFTACGDAQPDQQQPEGAAPAPVVGANVQLPEGITLDMVQQGKTVFETTICFSCHAMDASGTALAPSLRDQNWLNSDGSFEGIMQVVREGVAQPREYPSAMPPMGGARLTEDQIRDVSAYIYAVSRGG